MNTSTDCAHKWNGKPATGHKTTFHETCSECGMSKLYHDFMYSLAAPELKPIAEPSVFSGITFEGAPEAAAPEPNPDENWSHYTDKQGGYWYEIVPGMSFASCHSLKTEDGREWDRINGWRQPPEPPESSRYRPWKVWSADGKSVIGEQRLDGKNLPSHFIYEAAGQIRNVSYDGELGKYILTEDVQLES